MSSYCSCLVVKLSVAYSPAGTILQYCLKDTTKLYIYKVSIVHAVVHYAFIIIIAISLNIIAKFHIYWRVIFVKPKLQYFHVSIKVTHIVD